MICAFIASVAPAFGVVPECRALSGRGVAITPRTFHAWRRRPPSAWTQRDARLTSLLRGSFESGGDGGRKPKSLYGAVKAWGYLRREGIEVARCTVERLMRANGWRGNTRGRRAPRTTVPDPAQPRHPDLMNRDFRAPGPRQLLVADFTYVRLADDRFGYTAFVIDAFAGTILGWECSLSRATPFVQRAIAQAAQQLRRASGGSVPAGAIHHSDAGSTPACGSPSRCGWPGWRPRSDRPARLTTTLSRNDHRRVQVGVHRRRLAVPCPAAADPRPARPHHRRLVHWHNNARLMHRFGLRPPAEADAEYWNRQH